MPKRPRTHQIEDISRRKFEDIIPENWVFRSKDKDYGIDAEVEIFDNNDETTGVLFYVQLKATDSDELLIQRKVTLDTETLKYYHSLDLPVLIARYAVKTDTFYYEWSANIQITTANTKSISFSEKDIITLEGMSKLENALHLRRLILRKSITLPLSISINFENGIDNYFKFNFKKNFFSCITQPAEKAVFQIEISQNLIIVTLGIIKYIKHYKTNDIEDLIEKIYLGIINLLLQYEHYDFIPEIVFNSPIKDFIFTDDEKLKPLALCLLDSKYSKEAVESIIENYTNGNLVLSYFQFILWRFNRTSSKNIESIEHLFKTSIKLLKVLDNSILAAEHYNFANFLGNSQYYRKAISYYLKARKLDPSYIERSYYLNELAGCCFEVNKFKISSALYKISLEIEDDLLIRARYADSLMFSGNYSEAVAQFELFISSETREEKVKKWYLKYIVLSEMTKKYDVTSQKRDALKASELFNNINHSSETFYDKCILSLKFDFLCNLAWYNLGQTYKDDNSLEDSGISFIMAGLCLPNDYEAWGNALGIFWQLFQKDRSFDPIFILILEQAYFYNGKEFLDYLYSQHLKYNNQLIEIVEGMIEIIDSSKPNLHNHLVCRLH